MHESDFLEAVKKICREDHRYDVEAYIFVREALDFTAKMLDKPIEAPGRHVTGQELLAGIRTYVSGEFGPMALTVFNTWGVKSTEDFGEIVFNLVNFGLLGKTDEDKKEDFANGYDFSEAFVKPFLPKSTPGTRSSRLTQETVKRRKKKTDNDERI